MGSTIKNRVGHRIIAFLLFAIMLFCALPEFMLTSLAIYDGGTGGGSGGGTGVTGGYDIPADGTELVGYRFSLYDSTGSKKGHSADVFLAKSTNLQNIFSDSSKMAFINANYSNNDKISIARTYTTYSMNIKQITRSAPASNPVITGISSGFAYSDAWLYDGQAIVTGAHIGNSSGSLYSELSNYLSYSTTSCLPAGQNTMTIEQMFTTKQTKDDPSNSNAVAAICLANSGSMDIDKEHDLIIIEPLWAAHCGNEGSTHIIYIFTTSEWALFQADINVRITGVNNSDKFNKVYAGATYSSAGIAWNNIAGWMLGRYASFLYAKKDYWGVIKGIDYGTMGQGDPVDAERGDIYNTTQTSTFRWSTDIEKTRAVNSGYFNASRGVIQNAAGMAVYTYEPGDTGGDDQQTYNVKVITTVNGSASLPWTGFKFKFDSSEKTATTSTTNLTVVSGANNHKIAAPAISTDTVFKAPIASFRAGAGCTKNSDGTFNFTSNNVTIYLDYYPVNFNITSNTTYNKGTLRNATTGTTISSRPYTVKAAKGATIAASQATPTIAGLAAVTATADSGYVFDRWTTVSNGTTSSTAYGTKTLSDSTTLYAVFKTTTTQKTLTIHPIFNYCTNNYVVQQEGIDYMYTGFLMKVKIGSATSYYGDTTFYANTAYNSNFSKITVLPFDIEKSGDGNPDYKHEFRTTSATMAYEVYVIQNSFTPTSSWDPTGTAGWVSVGSGTLTNSVKSAAVQPYLYSVTLKPHANVNSLAFVSAASDSGTVLSTNQTAWFLSGSPVYIKATIAANGVTMANNKYNNNVYTFGVNDGDIARVSYIENDTSHYNDAAGSYGWWFLQGNQANGTTSSSGANRYLTISSINTRYAIQPRATVSSYTATFNPNGGTFWDNAITSFTSTETKNYTINDILTAPHLSISKSGYNFAGWAVTSGGGSWSIADPVFFPHPYLKGVSGQYGNVTFTAQWVPVTYTVYYYVWDDVANDWEEMPEWRTSYQPNATITYHAKPSYEGYTVSDKVVKRNSPYNTTTITAPSQMPSYDLHVCFNRTKQSQLKIETYLDGTKDLPWTGMTVNVGGTIKTIGSDGELIVYYNGSTAPSVSAKAGQEDAGYYAPLQAIDTSTSGVVKIYYYSVVIAGVNATITGTKSIILAKGCEIFRYGNTLDYTTNDPQTLLSSTATAHATYVLNNPVWTATNITGTTTLTWVSDGLTVNTATKIIATATLTTGNPTVYFKLDNGNYSLARTVNLKQGNTTMYTHSTTSAAYTYNFTGVIPGTYDIYVGSSDTGIDLTVTASGGTATVNYYTVTTVGTNTTITHGEGGNSNTHILLAGTWIRRSGADVWSTHYELEDYATANAGYILGNPVWTAKNTSTSAALTWSENRIVINQPTTLTATATANIPTITIGGNASSRTITPKTDATNKTLSYNGSSQSPAWTPISSTYITSSGTTSATNVGPYIATFTAKGGYNATYHTKTDSGLTRTITSASSGAFTVSSSNTNICTVSVSGSTITITPGATAGTATITVNQAASGSYSAASTTFTFTQTYNSVSRDWSINTIAPTITAVNAVRTLKPLTDLTKKQFDYTGSATGPVSSSFWSPYSTTYVAQSGTVSATALGTYTATFTAKGVYSATYHSKTDASLVQTLSSNSAGAFSASSSNTAVATVSVSGSTLTITPGTTAGTATITITQAANGNYKAGTKTITFSYSYGKVDRQWSIGSAMDEITDPGNKTGSRDVTPKTDAATKTFDFTGDTITPSWTPNSTTYITAGGTTSAINAGSYTATFTAKGGYNSTYHTISSATAVTIPITTTSGAGWTATSSNTNVATVTASGNSGANLVITPGTTAGTTTITLKSNSIANYNQATVTFTYTLSLNYKSVNRTWTINAITPTIGASNATRTVTPKTDLTQTQFPFTGSATGPSTSTYWSPYNATYVTQSGTVSGTSTGSYTATFTAKGGYNATYHTKADSTLTQTLSSSSAGAYTVSSNDTAIATVSVSGSTLTITPGTKAGTATITITQAANGNYKAATKTITFKQTYSSVNRTWSIGVVAPTITAGNASREVTPKTDAATKTFVFNGSSQGPSWTPNSTTYITASGNTSATNVGNYTATFTAKGGYNSTYHTTSDSNLSQTITTPSAGALSVSSSDTAVATVSISGKTLTITPGTKAGSTTITISQAASGDYAAGSKTITFTQAYKSVSRTWSITVKTPTISVSGGNATRTVTPKTDAETKTFSYDGNSHVPAWTPISSTYITSSGDYAAKTAVGSYTATFTAKGGYNSTYHTTVDAYLSQTLTSESSGAYTVSSSDTSVATVSVSGSTLTITPGTKAGSTTITISQAASGNYAAATKTITFTQTYQSVNRAWAIGSSAGTITNPGNKTSSRVLTYTPKTDATTKTFLYDGATHYPSWTPLSTTYVTASGTTSAQSALGNYTTTFTAKGGYNSTYHTASYGTYSAIAAFDVTVTPSTATLSATSSNTGVATVSVSGKRVTITPVADGTTTITLHAEASGYVINDVTFTVTVSTTQTPASVSRAWSVTGYKVNHYVGNGTAGATYTLNSSSTVGAASGASITIANLAKTITGYTFEGGKAGTAAAAARPSAFDTSTTVLANGTRVVNLYYKVNSYTVQYYLDGVEQTSWKTTYNYGATITYHAKPTKTGYTVSDKVVKTGSASGTTITAPTTMPAYNLYVCFTSSPAPVNYTVKHWVQRIGAASTQNSTNYAEMISDRQVLTANTGSSVTPETKTYEHYTSPSTQTVTVAADGSTVVNYYYTVKYVTITVNTNPENGTYGTVNGEGTVSYTVPSGTVIQQNGNTLQIIYPNMLINSELTDNLNNWSGAANWNIVTEDGKKAAHVSGAIGVTKTLNQNILPQVVGDTAGQVYLLTAEVKLKDLVSGPTNRYVALYFGGNRDNSGTSTWMGASYSPSTSLTQDTEWVTVSSQIRFAYTPTAMTFYLYARDFTGDFYVRNVKLQKIENVSAVNGKSVTATPLAETSEYTYSFTSWSNVPAQPITANRTVTANFDRALRTANPTVYFKLDASDYSLARTVYLKQSGTAKYTHSTTTAAHTYAFTGVLPGTYDIFAGTVDTGVDLVVTTSGGTATVNYYTVTVTKGSNVSAATVNSSASAVVLSGTSVTFNATKGSATGYTYSNTITWTSTAGNLGTFTSTSGSNASKTITAKTTVTASTTRTANNYTLTVRTLLGSTVQNITGLTQVRLYTSTTTTKPSTYETLTMSSGQGTKSLQYGTYYWIEYLPYSGATTWVALDASTNSGRHQITANVTKDIVYVAVTPTGSSTANESQTAVVTVEKDATSINTASRTIQTNSTRSRTNTTTYTKTVKSGSTTIFTVTSGSTKYYSSTYYTTTPTISETSSVSNGAWGSWSKGTATLSATANTGYGTPSWSVTARDSTSTAISGTTLTFYGNTTVKAQASINTYTVTWKSQDGTTTYETDTNVAYGTKPSYDSAAPTKAADAQYTYTFAGWSTSTNNEIGTAVASLPAVTGNVTYYATFSKTLRTYTVTINVNPAGYGSVSRTSVTGVPYGTVLSTSGSVLTVNGTNVTATPTAASAQYTYSFNNWTNGTVTVTGNTTVTANFTRTTRNYTITIGYYSYGVPYNNSYAPSAQYGTSNKVKVGSTVYDMTTSPYTAVITVPYGTDLSTLGIKARLYDSDDNYSYDCYANAYNGGTGTVGCAFLNASGAKISKPTTVTENLRLRIDVGSAVASHDSGFTESHIEVNGVNVGQTPKFIKGTTVTFKATLRANNTFVDWYDTDYEVTMSTNPVYSVVVASSMGDSFYPITARSKATVTVNVYKDGTLWTPSNGSVTVNGNAVTLTNGTATIDSHYGNSLLVKASTIPGTGSYENTIINTTLTGSTTVRIDYYTLTVNPYGGSYNGSTANSTFVMLKNATKNVDAPTRTGYTFLGWVESGAGYMDSDHYKVRDGSLRDGVVVSKYNNTAGSTAIVVAHGTGSINDPLYQAYALTNYDTITYDGSGSVSPGRGGWVKSVTSQANHQYVVMFIAKVPAGYTLNIAANAMGSGGNYGRHWITSNAGTGAWQLYAYEMIAGESGTFSTFGHTYLAGGSATAPYEVLLGYHNIVDLGTTFGVPDYTSTYTNAGTTTLTAAWVPVWTVTYDANGGKIDGSATKVTNYNEFTDLSLISTLPVREGFEFTGWKVNTAVGNWTTGDYTAGQHIGYGKFGNVTMVAQWKALTVNIPVTKTWNDSNNAYNTRPASITVTLTGKVGSTTVYTDTLTLNAAGSWKGTFNAAPIYDNGSEITYTVSESTAGYTASVSGNKTSGFTISNTLNNVTLTVNTNINSAIGSSSNPLTGYSNWATVTYYNNAGTAVGTVTINEYTKAITLPYGCTYTIQAKAKSGNAANTVVGTEKTRITANGTVTIQYYSVQTKNSTGISTTTNDGTSAATVTKIFLSGTQVTIDAAVGANVNYNKGGVKLKLNKDGAAWNGQKIYLSTSASTNSKSYTATTASGIVTVTGLTSGTTYYVWTDLGYTNVSFVVPTGTTGYTWSKWTGTGEYTSKSQSITVNKQYIETANAIATNTEGMLDLTIASTGKVIDYYTLTLNKDNGINTVTGAGVYLKGATATINATAKAECQFNKWQKTTGSNLTGAATTASNSIVMNATTTYMAISKTKLSFHVTTDHDESKPYDTTRVKVVYNDENGAEQTVYVDIDDNGNGSVYIPTGTTYKVYPATDGNEHYTSTPLYEEVLTVPVTKDIRYFTVSVSGQQGVTSTSNGGTTKTGNSTNVKTYLEGTTVTIDAAIGDGYAFDRWNGSGSPLNSSNTTKSNSITVTDISAYVAQTKAAIYTLTIHYYVDGTTTKVFDDYVETYAYGDFYMVDSPSKYGYVLKDNEQSRIYGTMGNADVTVTVYYIAGEVSYLVNHHLRDLNATTYTLAETEYKHGVAGTTVTLANLKKTFAGFTYSHGQVGGSTVTTATIRNDGSLVIDLYYNRITYNVIFRDYNSTQISQATYQYGATVVVPADPTRAADNTYTYTFNGWTPEVETIVTHDAVYTATYTPTYREYTVRFVDYDDTLISSKQYHYGDTITVPADPARPSDGAHTYTFDAWTPTVSMTCVGNATYKATYTTAVKTYTVVFKQYDGSVISTRAYNYGDTVVVPATPTRSSGSSIYTYVFDKWTPDVETTVTHDAVYTATYIAVDHLHFYTVRSKGDYGITATKQTVGGTTETGSNSLERIVPGGASDKFDRTIRSNQVFNVKAYVAVELKLDGSHWIGQDVDLYTNTASPVKAADTVYNSTTKKYVSTVTLAAGTYKVYVNGADTGKTITFTAVTTRSYAWYQWTKESGSGATTTTNPYTVTINDTTTYKARTKYTDTLKVTVDGVEMTTPGTPTPTPDDEPPAPDPKPTVDTGVDYFTLTLYGDIGISSTTNNGTKVSNYGYNSKRYVSGTTVTINTEARSDVTFKQWTKLAGSNLTSAATTASNRITITSTTTYRADTKVTITYKMNGGKYNNSTADYTQTVDTGTVITLINPTPPDNKAFGGWYTTVSTTQFGGGIGGANAKYTLKKNMTVYAGYYSQADIGITANTIYGKVAVGSQFIASATIINHTRFDVTPAQKMNVRVSVYQNSYNPGNPTANRVYTATISNAIVPRLNRNLVYATIPTTGWNVNNSYVLVWELDFSQATFHDRDTANDRSRINGGYTRDVVTANPTRPGFELTAPGEYGYDKNASAANTAINKYTWEQWTYSGSAFSKVSSSDQMKVVLILKPENENGLRTFTYGAYNVHDYTTRSGYGFSIHTDFKKAGGAQSDPVKGETFSNVQVSSSVGQMYGYMTYPEFSYSLELTPKQKFSNINATLVGGKYRLSLPIYSDYQTNDVNDKYAHYTPLWLPDGLYTPVSYFGGMWSPVGEITARVRQGELRSTTSMDKYGVYTNTYTIQGSMYDDLYHD